MISKLIEEKSFILFIIACFFITYLATFSISLVGWVGFFFSAYSVIANDSIQTIGTFISASHEVSKWKVWSYLSLIMTVVLLISFIFGAGDVSFGLLDDGFKEVSNFSLLQLSLPIFLLVLTRYKIPVSTTFLILSGFATSTKSIISVVSKSLIGYVIAFLIALLLWRLFSKLITAQKSLYGGAYINPYWRFAQWVSTGLLWAVWIMQDAANIAIFLPRQLNLVEFLAFLAVLIALLGVLIYRSGGEIQGVIESKTDIAHLKSATFVDFIYAMILFIFKEYSKVPMSTTWVFIGLLAGREYGLKLAKYEVKGDTKTEVLSDFNRCSFGLIVSLLLAALANPF